MSLVRVDVTATGSRGTPVDDLTAADFEVEEDGVPQKIQSVQFVRLSGNPTDNASLEIRSREHAEAEAAREDVRVFAIFLDDYHISWEPQVTQPLRRALTRFVDQELGATDLAVIMDPVTPLSALEFTRSKPDLLARISKYEGRKGRFMPPRSVLEEAQMAARDAPRVRAQVTLTALTALVTKLGALRERRSSVIFVSEGPPLLFRGLHLEDEMRDLLRAAHAGNVTINVLDPRGLGQWGVADSMWRLALETGGRAIVNTNDLDGGLAKVAQDASAYYLIAYEPTRQADDGKFHKIDVRVLRKGVKVTARNGYWAPGEQEVATAVAAQAQVAPEVTQARKVFAAPKGGTLAALWVGIEPAGESHARVRLAWQPTGNANGDVAPEALLVTARDSEERVVAELRIARQQGGAETSPAGASFETAPGPLKLALVLQGRGDEVLDQWIEAVDVPDYAGSAGILGTPSILAARSATEYRQLVGAPSDWVPTPRREFRRTDRVFVRVPMGTSAAGTPLVARLLGRAGNALVTLPPVRAAGDHAQFELPISSLAAGEYLLEIRPEGAVDDSRRQLVAFRVVP